MVSNTIQNFKDLPLTLATADLINRLATFCSEETRSETINIIASGIA